MVVTLSFPSLHPLTSLLITVVVVFKTLFLINLYTRRGARTHNRLRSGVAPPLTEPTTGAPLISCSVNRSGVSNPPLRWTAARRASVFCLEPSSAYSSGNVATYKWWENELEDVNWAIHGASVDPNFLIYKRGGSRACGRGLRGS